MESRSLGLERKAGGKFHLKLNTGGRPIANKYREGKMKRTLERELKVHEIAEREVIATCILLSGQTARVQTLRVASVKRATRSVCCTPAA